MKTIGALLASLLFAVCAVAVETPSDSLYLVPFEWKDQAGRSLDMSSFKGKPVVLTLAYTKCKTACPLTMQRIKNVAGALKNKVPDAQFVIVSLDPKNDTPETLAKFKEQYKLDDARWHLLTGSEADVRKLAVLLGYSFQQQAGDGEIAHSNKIFGLDKEGRIATELEGLGSDIAPFVGEVTRF
ncbi:MAG: SCO family protein [Deltaproteobacteria bacterium]|nr:SCO family protein [Deltaproteobacteria bacterium]